MLNKGQASSAVQGKGQLLQGSGKRLPQPLQHQGVFQRFLQCLSVTHEVWIVAAEGKTHSDQRVWSGVAIHAWLPPRTSCQLDALRWEQSHVYLTGCSSKPRAEVQKQQQQTWSLQLRLVFQSGKGGSESFCSPGERVETNKKGKGRIKVILNH